MSLGDRKAEAFMLQVEKNEATSFQSLSTILLTVRLVRVVIK